jgi:hypothetical protein
MPPITDPARDAAQRAAWQQLWRLLLASPADPPAPADGDDAATVRGPSGGPDE